MLIVRLWGGIGNQLFQYAFGEFLRREFYADVDYDICSFGHSDKLRSLEIFPFVKEKLPIATSFKIRFSRYRGVLNKLLKFIYLLNPKHKIITENKWEAFCKQGLNISNEYYFQGYWQDEKFASFLLENNLLSINENELPKNLLDVYKDIKETKESVSLHVRRGDYFSPKNIGVYGVCSKDYYEKALNVIESKNKRIFVFSDDMYWVKNNIKLPENTVFVPNYNVRQFWYIYLMSKCKYNVISNSTFSWWGAFLNQHDDKVVLGPSKWLLNTDKSLMLNSWIKIDV